MYRDARQNHLGTTFSITLRKHLLPHELTIPTTSQVIVHASENSVDPTTKRLRHKRNTVDTAELYNSNGHNFKFAEWPYIENGCTRGKDKHAQSQPNGSILLKKLYRQSTTQQEIETSQDLKDNFYHRIPHLQQMRTDIDASKSQLYLN